MALILGDNFFGTALTANGIERYTFEYFHSDSMSEQEIFEMAKKSVDQVAPDKLKCALSSQKFTFLPMEFYDISKVETVARSAFAITPNLEIDSDSIYTVNMKNIYGVDKSKLGRVKSLTDNVRICHSLSPALALTNRKKGKRIWAFVDQDHVSIVANNDNKVVFSNIYKVNSPESLVYHILLSFYSAGYDPDLNELVISGRIEENSKFHNALRTYVRHIEFSKVPGFDTSHAHTYYDLYLLSKYI